MIVTNVCFCLKRSNSLLYPGITASANHHAFEHKCSDSLALAERPQILRPGVEKEQLFGLPIEQRSAQDHEVVSELFLVFFFLRTLY